MKKLLNLKLGPVYLFHLLIVILILVIGLIVGSFNDLNISKAIASENNLFGLFLNSFGELFGYAVAPVSGAILSRKLLTKESKPLNKFFGVLIAIITIVIVSYYMSGSFCGSSGYFIQLSRVLSFIICLLIYTGIYFLAFFTLDVTINTRKFIAYGLCVFLSILVPVLLVNFLFKGLAYRPRYRAMVWDNPINGTLAIGLEHYQNWWQFSFWKKPDWYYSLNIPSDYIKSWPSGHSACAAVTLSLPFYINLTKFHSVKREVITFIVAALYMFIVAFSRIVAGAHFLSDVSSGGLISCLFMLLIWCLVLKISKVNQMEN